MLIFSVFLLLLPAYAAGTFSITGSMNYAHTDHTATLLQNGKVLIVGDTQAAELYDPTSGTFSVVVNMSFPRDLHTATLLPNGKVLIAGGVNRFTSHTTNEAELYDPSTGTFIQTGDMVYALAGHTATLLSNGKVLIAGGEADGIGFVSQAELYDPSSGTFSGTGSMNYPRVLPTATLLNNGRVFLIGGDSNFNRGGTAEIYDFSTGTFSIGPTITQYVPYHHTATLLPNGQVLVVAGGNQQPTNFAFLYNPSTNIFSQTGNLIATRAYHAATPLPNGKVLISGGVTTPSYTGVTTSAELYDPITGTFSLTESMNYARQQHTSTLLLSGNVLVAGGGTQTAELYHPKHSKH